jgi:hypothetical protein
MQITVDIPDKMLPSLESYSYKCCLLKIWRKCRDEK